MAGHQCVGAVPHGQPRAKERRVGRWPLCSPPIVFRVSQSVINQRSTHKGGRGGRAWVGVGMSELDDVACRTRPGQALRVADTAAFIYVDCALGSAALSDRRNGAHNALRRHHRRRRHRHPSAICFWSPYCCCWQNIEPWPAGLRYQQTTLKLPHTYSASIFRRAHLLRLGIKKQAFN